MASKLEIANRALQKCGVSKRLGTFDDDNQKGRAIRTCYETLKEAELQTNDWTFAIERVQLAADTETPAFDYTYQYQLPANFLRLSKRLPKSSLFQNDYVIEGRKLLTNSIGPLNLRIIRGDVTEEWFHPLFVEGLASRIAFEIVEELTQSAAKQDGLATAYTEFISQARMQNAIEKGHVQPAVDVYETVRRGGHRNTAWYDGS